MKALKMALALAFTAATTVIVPTSASANAPAGWYTCYYQYSFVADGTLYDVYYCYPDNYA
ncbi:MAG TPA: hypothetical protein VFR28_04580 [Allosphingosinicella sp.]|nr:hypothetical protein [Allosphingosinicella sp.]